MLSRLQEQVLVLLAALEPPWTLTGGGALAGFHLGHRATRDVDLFFHGTAELGRLPEDALAIVTRAGLASSPLQRSPAFFRFQVDDGGERVVVDLVAEPVLPVHPPEERTLRGVRLKVDVKAELLINKIAALYSRAEIRDLVDTLALVDSGEDLSLALRDVHRKDSGFSPLDLAWVLRSLPVERMAAAEGLDAGPLLAFRDRLVDRLLSEE